MTRDEAIALLKISSQRRTICEIHREIYEALGKAPVALKETIRELVIEAFIMGKKMDAKLREYKGDWDDGLYDPNPDRNADRIRRSA